MLPQFIVVQATRAFEFAVNARGTVVEGELFCFRSHLINLSLVIIGGKMVLPLQP
jgi:hypothetical protein